MKRKSEESVNKPHSGSPVLLLSIEQRKITKSVLRLKNTAVIAKAGTGKTTTAIEIGKQFSEEFPGQKTLILTYNRRLKEESRIRIKLFGLENVISSHSYHAAAYNYFGKGIPEEKLQANDTLINEALKTAPQQKFDHGLIIIDEAQDMSELYCKFVRHMLTHFVQPPVMLIMGDPFQRIFGFTKSDVDYLINPEKYFGDLVYKNGGFQLFHLTISWRITHEMADWINTYLNPELLKYAYPDWWGKKS